MEIAGSVVELCQSVTHPGRRDEHIALFEEHLIDGQEACGMRIVGQFRCAGDPDRFVWMRAFSDMDARLLALEEFYCGPIWREHRIAAGPATVASSDALFLRPAGDCLCLDAVGRAARGELARRADKPGLVIAVIDRLAEARAREFARMFEELVAPALRTAGAALIGCFTGEPTASSSLGATGESIFSWLASFADRAAYADHRAALRRDRAWIESVAPAVRACLVGRERVLELIPTRRSLLRHDARSP
jgi:hypothetical protein